MTKEDFASASQLLDLLREKGAKSFEGFGIKLELSPIEASPAAPMKSKDADMCDCGHSLSGHVGGLCVLGPCEPSKCTPVDER